MAKYDPIVDKNGNRYFYRFSAHQRVQHVILFTCVIMLAVTGFPLRHADEAWAKPLYDLLGGPDIAPLIHRSFGSVLLGLFLYHTGYWIALFIRNDLGGLKREGRLTLINGIKAFFSQEMVPNRRDIKDFVQGWKFLLYLSSRPPRHERMSWREKFDYFAPYWGIPILGPAGVLLWWRDEVSHLLPGIVLNVAYIMHTDEALLAILFLFFVHWYNVHYAPEKFPGATVWLTGYLPEQEMIHEHYDEYVRVMTEQGLADQIKAQHFGGKDPGA
jgi:formate dehydrogenase subunit gamma